VRLEQTLWWGEPWQWATAAYWVAQASNCSVRAGCFRFGRTLREEVAACILGGFGMPAPVGLAAFVAVRDSGLLDGRSDADAIEDVLRMPISVGDRSVRYRFPRQRSTRLAAALDFIQSGCMPTDPVALRDWLLDVPGIGYKTASWVVRNHCDSDKVAIIDVHLRRAGEAAGVFDRGWSVERDYRLYEAFFLEWARVGEVRASVLDACIWSELAALGSTDLPTRHP
jgi:N-glycosylase/DNA lyase